MSKPGSVEIVAVIDKSGSMSGTEKDVCGGFNGLLKDQRKLPGEVRLTLTLFDTEYNIVHDGVPLSDVPDLTEATYCPSGMTALHDAVGRTIDAVGKRLAAMPEDERPEKVIFAILTDGLENSSREYTSEQVAYRLKRQREYYSWEFIFLGVGEKEVVERAGRSMAVPMSGIERCDTSGVLATAGVAYLNRYTMKARKGEPTDGLSVQGEPREGRQA